MATNKKSTTTTTTPKVSQPQTLTYGIPFRLARHTTSDQLFTTYRPMRFSELYGPTQAAADVIINSLMKNNRHLAQKAWLISGPPSSGKTTLAMIMAMAMNCDDPQPYKDRGKIEPCLECASCRGILDRGLLSGHTAFLYYNVASMRKEDIVEVIKKDMSTGSSLEGRFKIIVFEEAHNLTKQQKEALLKPVENTLQRVYLIFSTTEPAKLTSNRALRGRLTPLAISPWQDDDLRLMLMDIAEQEYVNNHTPFIDPAGLDRIITVSDGDARVAISNLQLILDGVRPADGKVITPDEVVTVLGRPVEYSDDFKKYFYAILGCRYDEAITVLDQKFDRVVGVEARPIAVATIKYLRRVAYSQMRKKNYTNARKVLRQLQAFNGAFWQQIADDFTALTIATFAALEAGGRRSS